ncbi:hypothetical protein [Lapidilactobacillus bayanensis]|uniref:hypothetical protein n=1 Tax=Lapidilactobacillus bayanensis TaxID=2485998 RepID=UPI000F7853EC|nr:hypothetical protein [Lapidilactobacillus bayanensis]
MVYLICGMVMLIIGILNSIRPAKTSHDLHSYSSMLAMVSPQGFYYAQRWCRNAFLTIGLIELMLGALVNHFDLNQYTSLWLVTIVFSIALIILHTESQLKHYLMRMGQLPIGLTNKK